MLRSPQLSCDYYFILSLISIIVELYVQVSLVQSPKLEYDESQSPYSNEKVMLLDYSSSLKQSEKFIMPLITIEKVQKLI